MEVQRLGYWLGPGEPEWPDPRDFVDESWDAREKFEIALYLKHGIVARRYMGYSFCRFCGENLGSLEYSDGVFLWPEGLAHYVEQHAVVMPRTFVEHVFDMLEQLEEATVDATWWRAAAPEQPAAPAAGPPASTGRDQGMDVSEARALAEELLDQRVRMGLDEEIVIIDGSTQRRGSTVVFFYNTARYLETGEISYALAGNGPIFIDLSSGESRFAWSGCPWEEQLSPHDLT